MNDKKIVSKKNSDYFFTEVYKLQFFLFYGML